MLLLQAKMRYRFGKRLDTFSVSGKKRIDSIVAVQNDKAQSPATLMDVAKEAQVSIATASRVLNGSTRKVRNRIARRGQGGGRTRHFRDHRRGSHPARRVGGGA